MNQQQKLEDTDDKKEAKALRERIAKLNRANTVFAENAKEYIDYAKQAITDWQTLLAWFGDNQYRDIEGLCKVVDLTEIRANDYSMTPGRYVGVSLSADDDFDYRQHTAPMGIIFCAFEKRKPPTRWSEALHTWVRVSLRSH